MARLIRFYISFLILITLTITKTNIAQTYQVVILHPAGFSDSFAVAISDGKIAGGGKTGGNYHALLWSGTSGSYVDLNPSGFSGSGAYGASGGQQVGYGKSTATGGNFHALLWTETAASCVDLNPSGFSYSWANGVSGSQQVGEGSGTAIGGNFHALIWSGTAGSYVDLNPSGFSYSRAYGVSGGQQVGYGYGTATGNETHALLWSGTAESCVDLHKLLPAGYVTSEALGIDSSGNIVGGVYTSDNHTHAVMWVPPSIFAPTISVSVENITFTKADMKTTLDDGGEECDISYSIESESGIYAEGILHDKTSGTYPIPIEGLTPGTMYYYTVDANNSEDSNSVSGSFTTDPNALIIHNFVKQFQTEPNQPNANQGSLTYVEKKGNLNGIDPNDIFYVVPDELFSKIVSLIPQRNLQGQVIDFNELSLDARPFPSDANDPNSSVLFELSIYNPEPNEPNQPDDPNVISENYLKFWLAPNAFKGKPVTIQQVSYDPNIIYPVWDVNQIIAKNGGKLTMDNIISIDVDPNVLLDPNCILDPNIPVKIIEPNVPYTEFTLSTNREIIDINDDRIIDLNDYSLLLNDLGKEGVFRTDIASMKNNSVVLGIPDGKVDETDKKAFITEYNKKHPNNPISDSAEDVFEDFESGQIEESFTTS